ncbi:peptidoglycan-binding protein [Methylobacterium sp. NMS14P]|uniref:peptidoglycan-binding protein n=1 Tax=Methylobacterium sp. NMS14P TaxID=2894310 RepID=UPI0023582127|nr:peptidoglycan-binding protein [Methylobacterium sp. NMS14P]WCS27208.1 peptidoglycan-binding protein [Methylobacterium sp. NMS14P]
MFSLSALLSTLLGLLARMFSDAVVKEVDSLRHDQDQRDLGAAQQANASTLVAEAQEARARAAADAAADGADNPDDLLPETTS